MLSVDSRSVVHSAQDKQHSRAFCSLAEVDEWWKLAKASLHVSPCVCQRSHHARCRVWHHWRPLADLGADGSLGVTFPFLISHEFMIRHFSTHSPFLIFPSILLCASLSVGLKKTFTLVIKVHFYHQIS